MTFARALTIELPDRKVEVAAFADGTLRLSPDAGVADYSGPATIVARKANAVSTEIVDLQVDGGAGNPVARLTKPGEQEAVTRLVRWLATDEILSRHMTAVPENDKSPAGTRSQVLAVVGLGILAVLLLLAISAVLNARRSSIFSEVAFVGLPGLYLDVPSSGRLEYVKADGALQNGELFATLRSSRGNPVFVEAGHAGMVRQVLKRSGDFVSKGDLIAVVFDGVPKPYAAVFVKPSDAIQAVGRGKATITLLSTGEKLEVALSSENIVLKPKRLVDERGIVFTEIDIPLPEAWESRMGEALHVEFDHARAPTSGWRMLSFLLPFIDSAFAGVRRS